MKTIPLCVSALTLALTSTAFAQAPGGGGGLGMPSEDEIRRRVQQVMDASPQEVIEIEGIAKITYKKVPTDPAKIAEMLGEQLKGEGKQLPPGVDIEQLAMQYQGQITRFLNEALADIGTFEAKIRLKIRSKRIPVGVWKLGIVFEGDRPVAFLVSGTADNELPEENKPIPVRLKTRGADLQQELSMEFVEPKRQKEGKEKFDVDLKFLRFQARTKDKLERAPDGEAPAGKDDDGDE